MVKSDFAIPHGGHFYQYMNVVHFYTRFNHMTVEMWEKIFIGTICKNLVDNGYCDFHQLHFHSVGNIYSCRCRVEVLCLFSLHKVVFICSPELPGIGVVIVPTPYSYGSKEALQVVLTQFVGQKISAWYICPLNKIMVDIECTSAINNKVIYVG